MKRLLRVAAAAGIAAGSLGIAAAKTEAIDYTSSLLLCQKYHTEWLVGSAWYYEGWIDNCQSVALYIRMDIIDGADSSNKLTAGGLPVHRANFGPFAGGSGGFRQFKGCTGAPCP